MSTLNNVSDEELYSRYLQRGSDCEECFYELDNRYRNVIKKMFYCLIGNESISEELTQDCFLVLIKKPKNFDPFIGSFRVYLFQMVRNQASMKNRRAKPQRFIGIDEVEQIVTDKHSQLESILTGERDKAVNKVFFQLNEDHRLALLLHHVHKMTYKEIAKVLNTEESTIRMRCYHGVAAFKKRFQKIFPSFS